MLIVFFLICPFNNFCFRVCIWNFGKWSVLFNWGSYKGYWHWAPISLLWGHQQQWDVWAAYQPHWLVWALDKVLMRTAYVVLLLTTDTCCLSGLFKVIPEEMSFCTVEEMVSPRPAGLPSFTSTCSSMATCFTVGAMSTLATHSLERYEGQEDMLRCQVQGQQGASVEVFSALGDFSESERKECFTLEEIMSSSFLRNRRFRFIDITNSEIQLLLTPIYQVHAIMNCENNLLFF